VLEYALGAATVGIAWSEYLNKLLEYVGMHIPYEWCHSPFESSTTGVSGIMNIPALFIIFLLSMLLIRGTKESAWVNGVIVITKVAIVILFIIFGWSFINPVNHQNYIPEATTYIDSQGVDHNYGGIMGILGAAGVVFFCIYRF
jgi:APA family basic amino acid/polyamine antiporter